MKTPTQCLSEIRRAVGSDGEADLRALTILEATRSLAGLPATVNQALALRALSRVALSMAGLRHDDLRRFDVLSDLAKAWLAFEGTWYDEQGSPLDNQGQLGTSRLPGDRR
ncbi:hypothetical protein [Salinarimonas soli]|uniref:Uncharacterized protein n=1 Tax=Salinarimonas soli TaxID=1638099 RepID=A0A5B2V8M8_9HYPH|nr:hypothetical protein [Salinarimonas soli]KAA2234792.1 hypothetical protein F0L46_22855 [Salinarimonas soli]